MPLDTSSYYPEVPDNNDKDDSFSLNNRQGGLFRDPVPSHSAGETASQEDLITDAGMSSGKETKNPENTIERIVSIISHFLSWVLVPLLMPVYGLILAFGLSVLDVVPSQMKVRFILIIAGINFVIPILLVLLLKFLGVVEDVGLNGRKERLIPYTITVICFGASSWFLATKGAPVWLCMFYAGGALAALINLIVNFKWKISAHAAGIAGVIALLIKMEKDTSVSPELFLWLLIVIGLTGLMGSARIWLGRHTVWQVLAGYAVGFCSVFFLMDVF